MLSTHLPTRLPGTRLLPTRLLAHRLLRSKVLCTGPLWRLHAPHRRTWLRARRTARRTRLAPRLWTRRTARLRAILAARLHAVAAQLLASMSAQLSSRLVATGLLAAGLLAACLWAAWLLSAWLLRALRLCGWGQLCTWVLTGGLLVGRPRGLARPVVLWSGRVWRAYRWWGRRCRRRRLPEQSIRRIILHLPRPLPQTRGLTRHLRLSIRRPTCTLRFPGNLRPAGAGCGRCLGGAGQGVCGRGLVFVVSQLEFLGRPGPRPSSGPGGCSGCR
jgi:hypothetical protein